RFGSACSEVGPRPNGTTGPVDTRILPQMEFRLFGVNVEIQFGFWLGSFLLGWGGGGMPNQTILIWMAVVLISVLVHEFGHAFAIKRHGIEPEIALHWMGGTTSWRAVLP